MKEAKEVRSAYCLHALNHVLKANSRVISNNAKLKKTKDTEEDFRDQGITRPKVWFGFVYFECWICFWYGLDVVIVMERCVQQITIIIHKYICHIMYTLEMDNNKFVSFF